MLSEFTKNMHSVFIIIHIFVSLATDLSVSTKLQNTSLVLDIQIDIT